MACALWETWRGRDETRSWLHASRALTAPQDVARPPAAEAPCGGDGPSPEAPGRAAPRPPWACRPLCPIAMRVACCGVCDHTARGAATRHALELLARQAATPATPSPAGGGGPHLPHHPTGFATGERAPRGEEGWLTRVARGRSGLVHCHEALGSTVRTPPIGDASPTIAAWRVRASVHLGEGAGARRRAV